ncbi:hypothetical protein, partial [Mycobacterium asiaticum]|uniref:hypothetical protein n=1 Tax=Mycobacterium asiaticum TaxID=1790 RepID=UPI001C12B39A
MVIFTGGSVLGGASAALGDSATGGLLGGLLNGVVWGVVVGGAVLDGVGGCVVVTGADHERDDHPSGAGSTV